MQPEFTKVTAKKYVLLPGDTKTLEDGTVLFRIQGAESLGGYIQSEENLSQEGACWIDQTSMAYGGARIAGGAKIFNSAVSGNARVDMSARVNDSVITDNAVVTAYAHVRNALVADHAVIDGYARISCSAINERAQRDLTIAVLDHAHVTDGAAVHGHVAMSGHAVAKGNSVIEDHVELRDHCVVGEQARLRGSMVVGGTVQVLGRTTMRSDQALEGDQVITETIVPVFTATAGPLDANTAGAMVKTDTYIANGYGFGRNRGRRPLEL